MEAVLRRSARLGSPAPLYTPYCCTDDLLELLEVGIQAMKVHRLLHGPPRTCTVRPLSVIFIRLFNRSTLRSLQASPGELRLLTTVSRTALHQLNLLCPI